MKKTQMINSNISSVISKMGHTDTLVIGDAGLPIPKNVERIDLAVSPGLPGFLDVLKSVLTELAVQKVTIASEMQDANSALYGQIKDVFRGVEIEEVSHVQFKTHTKDAVAVIRTGECKPYANIILESGVVF